MLKILHIPTSRYLEKFQTYNPSSRFCPAKTIWAGEGQTDNGVLKAFTELCFMLTSNSSLKTSFLLKFENYKYVEKVGDKMEVEFTLVDSKK